MGKKNKIAFNTINRKLESREEFSIEELQKEIVDNGGIPFLNAGYSIKQYLQDLEKVGIIFLSPVTQKYKFPNQLMEKSEAYFRLD